MIEGVTSPATAPVRNVGLIAAAVLGHDAAIFLDDDEVVLDEDFLETALYGLGAQLQDGTPLLAKSGYYVDEQGRWQRHENPHWTDIFWRQKDAFNKALDVVAQAAEDPARAHRVRWTVRGASRHVLAVTFDPWVTRGEDIDYVINVRMHGGDVFIDDEWKAMHLPPEPVSEALRFRQDVYRFVYEHRKIEFAKSQVDLRPVTPKSMAPYPGDFIDSSVGWRAFVTALLRAVAGPERKPVLQLGAPRDARCRCLCTRELPELLRVPAPLAHDDGAALDDVALRTLFTGERRVDRTAITGRFPVVPPQ